MDRRPFLIPFFALTACAASAPLNCPDGTLEDEEAQRCVPTSIAGLQALCEEGSTMPLATTVQFPTNPAGCPWGIGDNLTEMQLTATARVELVEAVGVPEGAIACELTFDFEPDGPQVFRHDDEMFLLFADVVLAASDTVLVDLLPTAGRYFRLWDWTAIAGERLRFMDSEPYCLGGLEGVGRCEIPPEDTQGPLSFLASSDLEEELLYRAYETGNHGFTLVTVGDNDADTDCSSGALAVGVTGSYLVDDAE
ncbi:MAG: hypothetical protein ACFCGT_10345 [Sandaracinaceae bacterium]